MLRRFTGQVGLPQNNSAGYVEYRATYLETGLLYGSAENVTIGEGTGSGSSRLRFDFGASKMVAFGMGTGGTSEPNVPTCLFLTTHAESTVQGLAGSYGVAFFPTETSNLGGITLRGANLSLDGVTVAGPVDVTSGKLTTMPRTNMNGALILRG